MKRWMILGVFVQLVDVILVLALGGADGSQTLFNFAFLAGLPGNVVGAWAAEWSLFNSAVSLRLIGTIGMFLGILFNLLVWFALGYLARWMMRVWRRRSEGY